MPSAFGPALSVPVPISSGGTGATTQPAALNNLTPSQAGNANKLLASNGTDGVWQDFNGLGSAVDLALTDVVPIYHGGDNRIAADRLLAYIRPNLCDFRITAYSGLPVANNSGAANIYVTPYLGNRICLYDGQTLNSGRWRLYTTGELSLSLAGLGTWTPFDVWMYDSGGVPTLTWTSWTDYYTRKTTPNDYSVVYQDGVPVCAYNRQWRYLGTCFTNNVGAQCDDIANRRGIWNCYNRVQRVISVTDPVGSWTYQGSWRVARGNGLNRVDLICGLANLGSTVDLAASDQFAPATGAIGAIASINRDSADSSTANFFDNTQSPGAGYMIAGHAKLTEPALFGLRSYYWMEYSPTASTTFYGCAGGGLVGTYDS